MKISVITVVFNRASTIADALESVLGQSHPSVEHVVIDGGSTDGTARILESYRSRISKLVMEKDRGMYDALNKGIRMSTGEVIGVLHSDDFFSGRDTLAKVAGAFRDPKVESVYGDLLFVSPENPEQVVRTWRSSAYRPGLFRKGWHPPHTTVFVKKSVFERFGLYDLRFKIASDYEWMLRIFEKEKISSVYLPEVLVKMRAGGLSNRNIKNILLANLECYRAFGINGLSMDPCFILRKPLSKVLQFG